MRIRNLMVGIVGLLSIQVGCQQASYEFVDREAVVEEPDRPILPPVAPTPQPNEFWGENGFRMKINPFPGKAGALIRFEGTCGEEADGQLRWEFGDGQAATGNDLSHEYSEAGTFTVEASCEDRAGNIRKGSLTLVVAEGESGSPNQAPAQSPAQNRCRTNCSSR